MGVVSVSGDTGTVTTMTTDPSTFTPARKGDLVAFRCWSGGYTLADWTEVPAHPVWRLGTAWRCSRDGHVKVVVDLTTQGERSDFSQILVAGRDKCPPEAVQRIVAAYLDLGSPEFPSGVAAADFVKARL